MKARRVLLVRVYLVAGGFLLFALAILFQLFKIAFIEGDHWRGQSERLYLDKIEQVGERGDILSANGFPLATSVSFFDIRMDLNTQAMTNQLFNAHVDSLAWYLAKYIDPSRSPLQIKNHLIERRRAGDRYLLLKRNATFEEMNLMRTFPILRWGKYRGGLIVERKSRRVKPFNSLASRTIGLDRDNAANVGIEATFDQYLQGESGERLVKRVSGSNWVPVDDLASALPESGADVITTINTDIQDIVHHSLTRALDHHQAKYGVAIVMEVATGEIVAISNLERVGGSWVESFNHAIGTAIEPGSLFKIPSIMALLEDGYIDLDDEINLNNGQTRICNRTVRDSEPHEFELTTIRNSLEISSNVGIAQLVDEKYRSAGKEKQFIDHLRRFDLDKQTGIEIPGEAFPYIKEAGNRSEGWSCLSLPWMSFGYELSMTPLQLLTFYNGIANNGRMMKPFLVKEIQRNGRTERRFRPEVINSRFASPKTIADVKEVLLGVVENGTGRRIYNVDLPMAGKTGTTQLNYVDRNRARTSYQSSFVGYFPADNPKYSAIILVSEPNRYGFYGGTVAAPVFAEIAERVMGIQPDREPVAFSPAALNSGSFTYPFWQVGYANDFRFLLNSFNIIPAEEENLQYTILMPCDEAGMRMRHRTVSSAVVPNVVGMAARDAIYVLENAGLNVRMRGYGRVVGQSLPPGSNLNSKNIELMLDI
ncbi:MAG: PASTA domain-containing protein [Saprospirales bacterium]|nr:MAG: PASTA domain-containing protein [Saprospirales bacterium]